MDPPDPAPARSVLAATASRAFGWSLLNTAVSRVGTLGIGVVLARLLGPDEFGTYAVATVALLAVLSFNELGVSLAVVRWREDPAVIAPTVATLSALSSGLLCLAVLTAAPAFSAAMGAPSATPVVRVMATAILINGLVATPAALLQRRFGQRQRLVIDQVNAWLGAAVSLGLAVLGLGAMSLAVGRVVGSVAAAWLFVRWSPLPFTFGFDARIARELLRFGLPLAGASIVVFASTYTDQVVGGAVLGAQALGFYVLAANVANWPVMVLSQPLRTVTPAFFARLQDEPERMNQSFTLVLSLLARVSLPVCLVAAAVAHVLIPFVYGSQWAVASGVLALLVVAAAVRILFELVYDYLVVRGRTAGILVTQIVWAAAMLPVLLVGARTGGLVGLAGAQLATVVLVAAPLYLRLLRRCRVSLRDALGQLWFPLGVACLAAGGARLAAGYIETPFLALCVAAGVATASVVVLCLPHRHRLGLLRGRAVAQAAS